MNIDLLKRLGNISQVAGIRESTLLRGRGEGTKLAEFYNAAGLRFTVIPDRCMDLMSLSFKGVNFSFESKNGPVSPLATVAQRGEFVNQWPGGMLVTCGLDNVGCHCEAPDTCPTHGRISGIPAQNFGTESFWDGDEYVLRATGETHLTQLYGRHLSIRRTISTAMNAKSLRIHDVITNFEAEDEPFMLLYHCNFGYPLLDEDALVRTSPARMTPMNDMSADPMRMMRPVDGRGEELYLYETKGDRACGMIANARLGLGAYVSFDTRHLPNLMEWKNMKSHDYVLALEPTNTYGTDRAHALQEGRAAVLSAYSAIETDLEIGVLDGAEEIERFAREHTATVEAR